MNLDELITEANWSYLNSKIGSNNKQSKGGFNLFDYENGRQERIEKQIEFAKKQGNLEKVKELKKKLGNSDLGSDSDKDKNRGSDNVAKLKAINALKGKICFLMMNYANLTSGVGLDGDKSLSNATKVVKGKEGQLKVSGVPSDAVIKKHYDMLKTAIEQLKKYEYGYDEGEKHYYGAPKRYFDNKLERSKVLLKVLEEIKPEEISFDAKSEEVPISTDAAMVNTGLKTGRKNADGTDEKYAKINALKTNSKGEITTRIEKTKIAKILGKKRFNSFVYEALQPYIHEFQKYRKDWDLVKHPENIRMDFVSKDVSQGLDQRTKKANSYVEGKGKFSDFKKARKAEQAIGKISDAKNEKGEDGKIDHAQYSATQGAGKKALRNQIYGQARTDTQKAKTGNQGWLEAHHIEKLNLTKVKKIINGWIDAGKEPSVKDKTIIKFFGVMPGTAGQGGAGTLIFMHTDKPAPEQFSYEGLYAFKAGKSFMNGDLSTTQEKYVESHAGRKADAWKKGVLEALKKYDTEGNATVYTEEVNSYYFNY